MVTVPLTDLGPQPRRVTDRLLHPADRVLERSTVLGIRQRVLAATSRRPCVVEPVGPVPAVAPRVTVVVLCYRYGHFLPEAVRSVLDQEGVDVDVLIVDDASPDGSGDVAVMLAKEDDRIEAILLPDNVGPVRAYNSALPLVRGDYLVRLDADDLLTPGALARATALLEAHPEVGLVYGTPRRFSTPRPSGARLVPTSWTIWDGDDWLLLRCLRGVNCLTSPEAVIRADLQRELGGQDETLGHAHDMEMWLRAATRAGVGRVNGVEQAYVRTHAASRTQTEYAAPYRDLEERLRAFELALATAPNPRNRALVGVARQVIARESLDRARHAWERSLTDVEPVAAYLELARQAWPEITRTGAWRGYERRERIGARWAPWVPTYFGSAVTRSVRHRAEHQWWRRMGV